MSRGHRAWIAAAEPAAPQNVRASLGEPLRDWCWLGASAGFFGPPGPAFAGAAGFGPAAGKGGRRRSTSAP